jgi:hypothetical protein
MIWFLAAVFITRTVDLGLDLFCYFKPKYADFVARRKRAWVWLPLLFGVAVLYQLVPDRLARAREHSTLLKEDGGRNDELYRWLREESPKDAIYLTPPDLEGARFLGQRAIVVDWKAVPLIPTELLGWYERLCDVTGREVKNSGDLGGYHSMDPERLSLIVRKYHPDYLVLRRGGERRFADLPVVYQNSGYSVLKIAAAPARP